MSIQRGELKVLIDLLERDPTGVNACDEVRKETIWVQLSSFPEQVSIFFYNWRGRNTCVYSVVH